MRLKLFFVCTMLAAGFSCKKNNADFVTGTVETKGGCFSESWLVAIDHPNPDNHPFLRATIQAATIYNCSNAVFIKLPTSLAAAGRKIRFVYTETVGSCLSYSEAPNHINVSDLAALR